MAEEHDLFEMVMTTFIVKDGKYLITQRSMEKKRFPGLWTIPGGHLKVSDFADLPKDTDVYWYNALEQVLRREVREEVGLEIENFEYVTSLATVYDDGKPSLILTILSDYKSGEVKLQEGETDAFAWVSVEEAKNYPLIDGIYDELVMADNQRKGIKAAWKRVG